METIKVKVKDLKKGDTIKVVTYLGNTVTLTLTTDPWQHPRRHDPNEYSFFTDLIGVLSGMTRDGDQEFEKVV